MKKKLHFNHTSIQASKNKKLILQQVSRVIEDGVFLNGAHAAKLEQKLTELFGNYCLTTASGHDSLLLAIQALGLKPNDEVLFPVNSYPTAFPVFIFGLKGVPVDVDENGQMDPTDLQKKLSSKTKAIIVVHLYGLVGQFDLILDIVKRRKIALIEDCAQAFGTKFKNQLVGTFGDIGCYSFYPTKNVGTLGDGGALWAKEERFHNLMKQTKAYGESVRYYSQSIAGHSRLPEIQAAILNLYLSELQDITENRKKVYGYYLSAIHKAQLEPFISTFSSHPDSEPVVHLFVIRAKKREALRDYLSEHGVETLIHYPYPSHMVPAFKKVIDPKGSFPQAEKMAKQIVSLPFHQYMTKRQVNFIVNLIRDFYYST